MHIIVVSNRLATAKSLTLTPRLLWTAGLSLLATVVMFTALLTYLVVNQRLPYSDQLMSGLLSRESQKSEASLRQNINSLALRVGQLQAQLLRLDSLSQRLSALAGVRYDKTPQPGQGGALPSQVETRPLSPKELEEEVARLAQGLEGQDDHFSSLESRIYEQWASKSRIPTALPIDAQWNASSFGWRIDPITGERALHEGVDFVAESGTPIRAAAGGVVVEAGWHPQYGNMVEIDHGNDIVTRYAHASRLVTKVGAIVKRGQKIAEVGSTGRSTGSHLHFEVRVRGVAQNPTRFLERASADLARAGNGLPR